MNRLKRKAVDEELAGGVKNVTGKVREGAGKVLGRRDVASRGRAEQAEGKLRERVGRAGRDVSDAVERAGERLRGKK
jgi:uncharacterized protein YjbJ (UPF0337 family)